MHTVSFPSLHTANVLGLSVNHSHSTVVIATNEHPKNVKSAVTLVELSAEDETFCATQTFGIYDLTITSVETFDNYVAIAFAQKEPLSSELRIYSLSSPDQPLFTTKLQFTPLLLKHSRPDIGSNHLILSSANGKINMFSEEKNGQYDDVSFVESPTNLAKYFPELLIEFSSSLLALDFLYMQNEVDHPRLTACGCMDGSIFVFKLSLSEDKGYIVSTQVNIEVDGPVPSLCLFTNDQNDGVDLLVGGAIGFAAVF